MTTYTISANGMEMGNYQGETAEAAIQAYIADAGYKSAEQAAQACGQSVEAFLADIEAQEAEDTAECAYCGAEGQHDDVPASDDSEGWAKIADTHDGNCDWVLTRAHRIAASAADCGNLGELLQYLNTLSAEEIECRGDDMASLPTFGGEAPADTAKVWSWDTASLLVSGPGQEGCAGPGYKIVDREEWARRGD